MNSSTLVFDHVNKRYADKQVLHDVSFSLLSGITLLAGANGAGKSTLLRLASGLSSPTSGHVSCLSAPAETLRYKQRRELAFQMQDAAFMQNVRVSEYVELYLDSYADAEYPRAMLQKRSERFARLLDMESVWDQYASRLSGGQKRRVTVFLAILGHPKLLLLDEPTAGTDVEIGDAIQEVLSLIRQEGTDVIIASHDLDIAFAVADNVLILGKDRYLNVPKTEFVDTYSVRYKTFSQSAIADWNGFTVTGKQGYWYYSDDENDFSWKKEADAIQETSTRDMYDIALATIQSQR